MENNWIFPSYFRLFHDLQTWGQGDQNWYNVWYDFKPNRQSSTYKGWKIPLEQHPRKMLSALHMLPNSAIISTKKKKSSFQQALCMQSCLHKNKNIKSLFFFLKRRRRKEKVINKLLISFYTECSYAVVSLKFAQCHKTGIKWYNYIIFTDTLVTQKWKEFTKCMSNKTWLLIYKIVKCPHIFLT